MAKQPIIIIDDDKDDYELMYEILMELQVIEPIRWFKTCKDALDYLLTTTETVFIIFSDINLPRMSRIEMRREIDKNDYLRQKSIPFVFYTTHAARSAVDEAYKMIVQGFFVKEHDKDEIKDTVDIILKYWRRSVHPNNIK